MAVISHLRSLQALDMAIREGSLKRAAARLGITPAAVGQRIRALEDYLGTDLLMRGRSGLIPTPELDLALGDLRLAFDALHRVTETLDFQRTSEIHIVAEPDWAELWLLPRMPEFRKNHPNILFCINGVGDIPVRLGAPDLRIGNGPETGENLFTDALLPVAGPDNIRRIAAWDAEMEMEGMPLLHLKSQKDDGNHPGWVQWFAAFGHRRTGPDRGVIYPNARLAVQSVRLEAGFLVCGLSLVFQDLDTGSVVLPFPLAQHLIAPHPYRMKLRPDAANRPQTQRFIEWLRGEAVKTERRIKDMTGRNS